MKTKSNRRPVMDRTGVRWMCRVCGHVNLEEDGPVCENCETDAQGHDRGMGEIDRTEVEATVVHGCYRVLAEAVEAAGSVPASVVSGSLGRVLIADALIRKGWVPPARGTESVTGYAA